MSERVPDGWVKQEAGWWTKDGVGGVCREKDGYWWAYSSGMYRSSTRRCLTMREAMKLLDGGETT